MTTGFNTYGRWVIPPGDPPHRDPKLPSSARIMLPPAYFITIFDRIPMQLWMSSLVKHVSNDITFSVNNRRTCLRDLQLKSKTKKKNDRLLPIILTAM